eukprot:COSAG06_NODE_10908_length_1598_cov_1.166111_3_plen_28_part_01
MDLNIANRFSDITIECLLYRSAARADRG